MRYRKERGKNFYWTFYYKRSIMHKFVVFLWKKSTFARIEPERQKNLQGSAAKLLLFEDFKQQKIYCKNHINYPKYLSFYNSFINSIIQTYKLLYSFIFNKKSIDTFQ
jgi:hypothetical protein